MVRFGRRLMAVLTAIVCLTAGARAEAAVCMEVYAAGDAIAGDMAGKLVRLLGEAFPQVQWQLADARSGDLRRRVMDDRAPDLAICTPGEAMPWAREGMLLPLDGRISGAGRIQREALEPGVWGERLYMAPLFARHRKMAVNAEKIRRLQMDGLLDGAAYPVWQPSQLERVLEEFYLAEETGMEVWPPDCEGEAILAFVQALYAGAWLDGEGRVRVGAPAAILGAGWLGEMVKSGVIGYAESRGAALERFLDGETAVFIDWTGEEEKRLKHLEGGAPFELAVMAYPSADDVPVCSFELTGVCAFASGDMEKDALLYRAASFLHENGEAQVVLGARDIWQDDALWLRTWDTDACGATLRRLAAAALEDVVAGGADAANAFSGVQAAMDTAGLE